MDKDGNLDPILLGLIHDIHELPSGAMIIGTDGAGIALFDKTSHKITWRQPELSPNDPDEYAALNRSVKNILVDSKKRIWISTARGINQFDEDQKHFHYTYPTPKALQLKKITPLLLWQRINPAILWAAHLGRLVYI